MSWLGALSSFFLARGLDAGPRSRPAAPLPPARRGPDPEGAAAYLGARRLDPARSSSLRKLQKAKRIAAGLRPRHLA